MTAPAAQFAEAADRGDAVDLGIVRIHQPEFAFEFCLVNIRKNGPPDGPLARAGPDQRERTRRKEIFQTVSRHQFNCPAGAGLDVMNLSGLHTRAR